MLNMDIRKQNFIAVVPCARPPLPRMQNNSTYRSSRSLSNSKSHHDNIDDDSNDDSDESDASQDEIRSEGFRRMDKEYLVDAGSLPILPLSDKMIRRKNRRDPDDSDDEDADDDDDDDWCSRKSSKTNVDSSREIKKSLLKQNQTLKPVNNNNFFRWLLLLLFCIAIIFICIRPYLLTPLNAQNIESSNNATIMKNFKKNINDIKLIFKNQDDTIWNDIEGRIYEIIVNPKRPTIIFLFSNDDQPMFCLARLLGNASRSVLNCDEDLLLTADDSILGDNYGIVIENLKDKINQQRVVIFENILNIKPEAMRAFHNLCDSENPLVKNAIYILTMVNHKNNNNDYKKKMNTRESMKFIENQLTQKLIGNIDPDKLQPLVTRMTDAVLINVQSEPEFKSCPLRY